MKELSHTEAQSPQGKAKDKILIIKKLCDLCVLERSGREISRPAGRFKG